MSFPHSIMTLNDLKGSDLLKTLRENEKIKFILESANSFDLDQSENLSFGKEITNLLKI